VTLPDLLFSFSSVGYEVVNKGVPSLNPIPISSPTYIPVKGDEIDAIRTVSYVNNSWSWSTGYQRHPDSKIMLTLLDGFTHTIWNSVLAQGDRLTWVFLQTRAPGVRNVFSAARLNTTRAMVNQPYSDTLVTKVTAPSGATFIRDVKGPAWLKVAPDGTLSGTPGVADLGINTWDITVSTINTNNVPITESAELLIFVEAPGYNAWWQKQNGDTALSIPAINSGPAGDDDGDGLSNLFEYVTDSDPLQSGAGFSVSIAPVTGNPSQMQITYGPLIKGKTYTVKSADSLTSGTWASVNSFTAKSAATTNVIIVNSAVAPRCFYTVEISKP